MDCTGCSKEKIADCAAVLRALQMQPELFHSSKCREVRLALVPFCKNLAEQISHGELHTQSKVAGKKMRRREHRLAQKRERRLKYRAHDSDVIAETYLWKTRLQKLQALEPAAQALAAPDGTAGEYLHLCDSSSPQDVEIEEPLQKRRMLEKPKHCYVCKEHFLYVHHFYFRMCPTCADLNWAKRFQTADLRGRRAIVTGARVKIGFHVALKLLRAGAEVLATTRYPRDAVTRFAQMDDFLSWKDRLHVFGIDFRSLASVEQFSDYVKERLSYVDIIVHNAAQTIKRSGVCAESREEQLKILELAEDFPSARLLQRHRELAARQQLPVSQTTNFVDHQLALPTNPRALLDVNGLELDVSQTNSWMLKLHEVKTEELAEVFLINVLAPFVLTAKLRPALQRSPIAPRFVINVSAMEGKFNGFKQPNHPHTNMAKAALNMMTRTCAQDFQQDDIFMNSVDTGWVNDERPLHVARKQHQSHSFQPPLDEIDAASRILDPIFSSINALPDRPVFCKFFKDYKETTW